MRGTLGACGSGERVRVLAGLAVALLEGLKALSGREVVPSRRPTCEWVTRGGNVRCLSLYRTAQGLLACCSRLNFAWMWRKSNSSAATSDRCWAKMSCFAACHK